VPKWSVYSLNEKEKKRMKKRFTEEQIIGILKQQESGVKTADVCREHNISQNTFYTWKSKFGGMSVSEAQRLKALEAENAKLKRIVADLTLDNVALKDVLSKNW
jgi:putative transposase